MPAKEKVSTVGIRYQVTLPKAVREKLRISKKTGAFIQAGEGGKILVITLNPPEKGVYNRIKISDKGQLVVPKSLRESKGIVEGTNLVFSVEGSVIKVEKLQKRKRRESDRWNFLTEVVELLQETEMRVENGSLEMERIQANRIKEILDKVEGLVGMRLLIERTDDGKVKLRPLG